jgi:hypothetical protein
VLEQAAGPRSVLAAAQRALRSVGLLFRRELHPYQPLQGIQARFPGGEALVLVETCRRTVAEHVNGALACGIELSRLEEWQDGESGPEPPATGRPKLLSLLVRRGA